MNTRKCASFIICTESKTLVLEKKGYQINQCNTSGHRFTQVSWDMNSVAAHKMGKSWHEYCPLTIINWISNKTLQQVFNYYGMELLPHGRQSKMDKLQSWYFTF